MIRSATSATAASPTSTSTCMASFIHPLPVTSFCTRQTKLTNPASARRPRPPDTPSDNKPTTLFPFSAHHTSSRITCSTASPGKSQSQDDRKDKRKVPRSKQRSDRRNLEMGWNFQMSISDKPVICKTCKGTGRVECSWCHATGVLMLGDRLMCSVDGHSHCLACDNGEVQCKECKGTGKLASWMVIPDL